jgi:N-acetylneuraminic acid mutarotase
VRPVVVTVALLAILIPILGVAAVGAATDCANQRCTHLPLLIAGGAGNAPDPSATGATATTTLGTATTTATTSPTDGTAEPSETASATATSSATASATATNSATASATATSSATSTTTPTTPTTISNFTEINWGRNGMPDYPISISEAQAVTLGGKLFTFSGFSSSTGFSPVPNAYAYDPVVNKWISITDFAAFNNGAKPGGTHVGVTTDGTYIYFASAYSATSGQGQIFNSKYVWRYDPAADPKLNLSLPPTSNPYTRLADLPSPRAAGQLAYVEYTDSAGELKNELHYIGGTYRPDGRIDPPSTYDLDAHVAIDINKAVDRSATWQTRAPLPNARHHASSAVIDGKIFFIGGQQGHDGKLVAQRDVHIYDPKTNTWQTGAPLPVVPATTDPQSQGRNHVGNATLVLGGRIILVGGQSKHSTALATVLAYDPQANEWTQLTSLPQGRHSAVAGAIDGRIYLSSGNGAGRSSLVGVPQLD